MKRTLFIVTLLAGSLFVAQKAFVQGIPPALQIKAARIAYIYYHLDTEEAGSIVTRYYYITALTVPQKVYGKTALQIKQSLDTMKLPALTVFDNPAEDISRRTSDSYTFTLGRADNGDLIKETTFVSGLAFVQKLDTGQWYQVSVATTTPDVFKQFLGQKTLKQRIASLFLGSAQADVQVFYPDPSAGLTTFDGVVSRNLSAGAGEAWSTIRAGAGTLAGGRGDSVLRLQSDTTCATNWRVMNRYIATFNTASLTSSATISAATFSASTQSKQDNYSQSIVITSSTPASNNALVAADYGQVGTIPYATSTIASTAVNVYTNFALNANGLSNINKTGISKFGARLSGDLNNLEPTCSNNVGADWHANLAAGNPLLDTKLSVTYTIPSRGVFFQNSKSTIQNGKIIISPQ